METKTQPLPLTKRCGRCRLNLSLNDFGSDQERSGGKAIYCLHCNLNRGRQYAKTEIGKEVRRRASQKYAKSEKGKAWRAAYKPTRDREIRTKYRFSLSKSLAIRKGKGWSLTKEEYEVLLKMSCHYCGGLLPETSFGLDRKDNSRGYDPDNVFPCCSLCNYARRDQFTVDEMEKLIGPAIRLVRIGRGEKPQ